jgi:hypothetical protein
MNAMLRLTAACEGLDDEHASAAAGAWTGQHAWLVGVAGSRENHGFHAVVQNGPAASERYALMSYANPDEKFATVTSRRKPTVEKGEQPLRLVCSFAADVG